MVTRHSPRHQLEEQATQTDFFFHQETSSRANQLNFNKISEHSERTEQT